MTERISPNLPAGAADPLQRSGAAAPAPPTRPSLPADAPSFQELLAELGRPGQLQFSRHALQRLQRRELAPTPDQLGRLGQGADLAAAKGSRAAAVLVDDLAFVVAVPARTVVTAIDRRQMTEKIFTNIDAAVIA